MNWVFVNVTMIKYLSATSDMYSIPILGVVVHKNTTSAHYWKDMVTKNTTSALHYWKDMSNRSLGIIYGV